MCNFIKDYPQNPALAISEAQALANRRFENLEISDDLIWSQISSPEFRLYEEIVLS